MNTVKIKVYFFGKARDLSGKKEDSLIVDSVISVDNLSHKLVNTFSLQDIQQNFILALNEEYLTDNSEIILQENDTVAVIPPLSGGTLIVT